MFKKIFNYIENIWIGNDGKPSLRRILAISFSISLIIIFHRLGNATINLINKAASSEHLDSLAISSISSFLANLGIIIGIEAGLIAGLLSLTTYQSLQSKQPYDSLPYQNVDQTEVPKVPIESTGS